MEIMKREWTYNVIERKEGWAGNYGGKDGKKLPGRLTGGVLVAESEKEAKAMIKELHGDNCEFVEITARGAVIDNL